MGSRGCRNECSMLEERIPSLLAGIRVGRDWMNQFLISRQLQELVLKHAGKGSVGECSGVNMRMCSMLCMAYRDT